MNFPDFFLILTLQCSHKFPGFRSQFSPVLTVYARALGKLLNLSVPRFLPLEVRVVTVAAHWVALRIGYVQTHKVQASLWYVVHSLRAGRHCPLRSVRCSLGSSHVMGRVPVKGQNEVHLGVRAERETSLLSFFQIFSDLDIFPFCCCC